MINGIKKRWLAISTWLIGIWIFIKWIYIILTKLKPGQDPWSHLTLWYEEGIKRCYSRLEITLSVDDQLGALPADRPIILIGPHISTLGMFGMTKAVHEAIPDRHVIAVGAKPEFKNMCGFFGKVVGRVGGILIDRNNRDEAIKTIKKGANAAKGSPLFLIYPESHRMKPKKLRDAYAYLRSINREDLLFRYRHTLVPRYRGIAALISAVENPLIIRLITVFDKPGPHLVWNMQDLIGANLHTQLVEITLPKDIEELKKHLLETLFPEINDVIDHIIIEGRNRQTIVKTTPVKGELQ